MVTLAASFWQSPVTYETHICSEVNLQWYKRNFRTVELYKKKKGKAVPLHAMEALGGRGGIAPTHSRPRH
jgi:hypothetical protein